MAQTFYWYDYETFGLDKRADRPAQFAGLRTDMNFNLVDNSEMTIYAKPSMDYLPSPESSLLTGILPQTCQEKGLIEADFAQKIYQEKNTPETISLGYNTLGFDDEVSRFLFWRNFLPAYNHMFQNGCSRWDIFPLVLAVWALRPEALQWVRWEEVDEEKFPKAKGKEGFVFKLELLSQVNGLSHEKAHDALSDVYATVALAKRIQEKVPKLWQWALENRTKEKIREALSKDAVLWINPRFGQTKGFMRIVKYLGTSPENKNEVFVWDLMQEPSILSQLTPGEWKERLMVPQSQLPEGVAPLPIYKMKINQSPFVCADLRVIGKERAQMFGLNFETIAQNSQKLNLIGREVESCLYTHAQKTDKDTILSDVDEALYEGGFPSFEDKNRMAIVQKASPLELQQMVAEGLSFDDNRYNELLFRYRARNGFEALSQLDKDRWLAHCRERLIDGKAKRSISDFFEQIDELQEAVFEDESKSQILEALYEWGESIGEQISG